MEIDFEWTIHRLFFLHATGQIICSTIRSGREVADNCSRGFTFLLDSSQSLFNVICSHFFTPFSKASSLFSISEILSNSQDFSHVLSSCTTTPPFSKGSVPVSETSRSHDLMRFRTSPGSFNFNLLVMMITFLYN